MKIKNQLDETLFVVIKSDPNARQVTKAQLGASPASAGIAAETSPKVQTTTKFCIEAGKEHSWNGGRFVSGFIQSDDHFSLMFENIPVDPGGRYEVTKTAGRCGEVKDLVSMEVWRRSDFCSTHRDVPICVEGEYKACMRCAEHENLLLKNSQNLITEQNQKLVEDYQDTRKQIVDLEKKLLLKGLGKAENEQGLANTDKENLREALESVRKFGEEIARLQEENLKMDQKVQVEKVLEHFQKQKCETAENALSGPCDGRIKIVLIGDQNVGKTSICLQFAEGHFSEEHHNTIGVDFRCRMMDANVDGQRKRYKVTVWDTAGQEEFRALTASYYRDAQGVILVYDVTEKESFDNLVSWDYEVERFVRSSPENPLVKMVVGNKIDLSENRVVPKASAKEWAEGIQNAVGIKNPEKPGHGACYAECSAKSKEGISNVFNVIFEKILQNQPTLSRDTAKVRIENVRIPKRHDSCC
jgi:Ras-related protein Rab-18